MAVSVTVVVPVYLGEETLEHLVDRILPITHSTESPNGHRFVVEEIVLVHDCGPDNSEKTIRLIAQHNSLIKPVWLSKNFGQHPATLAGMASSRCDWIVTLDEDLQHNPLEIGNLLDCAFDTDADVVYGIDRSIRNHGALRSRASRLAKTITSKMIGNNSPRSYSSFRLIRGNIARGISAYVGEGVYLDVALTWITAAISNCDVTNSKELRNRSGYTYKKLLSHFLRLILSNGTKPLRLVTISGMVISIAGISYAAYISISVVFLESVPEGWTSLLASILIIGGLILASLGVIAEYLGFVVRSAFGKPNYFVLQESRKTQFEKDSKKASS